MFVLLSAALLNSALVTTVMVFFVVVFLFARDLPEHDALLNYKPAEITQIYSVDGVLLDEFATQRRIFTPIDDIPEVVKNAFISAEDKNFLEHSGYDLRAIGIALVDALRTGDEMRGASTITQQVLKNFLLADDPPLDRKVKEFILANRIETALGKDRILELYLNEIFLGQDSYGVTAAARTYFNKSLEELELREAAVLAALPKAPSKMHPVDDMARLRARRNYVLREMHENGFITQDVYNAEIWAPLETVQSGDIPGFAAALPPRSYFTDEIRRQLTETLGEERFKSGGLTIRASVDPEMQRTAAQALRRGLESYDRKRGVWRPTGQRVAAADLASEPAWRAALSDIPVARDIDLDGRWRPAVVLSLDGYRARIGIEGVEAAPGGHWINLRAAPWRRRQDTDGTVGRRARSARDLLRDGEVVHVRAETSGDGNFVRWSLRQVPEIQGGFMAMEVNTGRVIAMHGGFSYQHSPFNRATQAMRQPGSVFKPFVYAAALARGYDPTSRVLDAPLEIETPNGTWRPKNASGGFLGHTTLRTGLERSRNVMAVRLARQIGLDPIAELAGRLGIYDPMTPHLANVLGSQETTLAKLVAAFAKIANGGRDVHPTMVDAVLDRTGTPLLQDEGTARTSEPSGFSGGTRVLDAVTAYQLTSMMRGVVERGTASRAVSLPVPAAGKTGTTNASRDVWFVGFTSTVVAGCYMGFDDPRPLGPGAYGGTMCAPVFQEFMSKAVRTYGGEDFEVPEGGYVVKFNRHTGARLHDGASGPHVVSEFIRRGEEPDNGGIASATPVRIDGSTNRVSRNRWNDAGSVRVERPAYPGIAQGGRDPRPASGAFGARPASGTGRQSDRSRFFEQLGR
ncbi:penicillin-binding protein 1A [Roseovarius salinarum]|uniref:penicillin-binding protein 1A n=1 Tax=Roseovarius salinarum TaxID=1981892 RepID=UPI002FCDDD56